MVLVKYHCKFAFGTRLRIRYWYHHFVKLTSQYCLFTWEDSSDITLIQKHPLSFSGSNQQYLVRLAKKKSDYAKTPLHARFRTETFQSQFLQSCRFSTCIVRQDCERVQHTSIVCRPESEAAMLAIPEDFVGCKTLEDFLLTIDVKADQNLWTSHHLAAVVTLSKDLIYTELADLPRIISKGMHRKEQVQFCPRDMQLLLNLTSDSRWQHLLSILEDTGRSMFLKDQIRILQHLNYLFISQDEKVYNIFYQNCLNNVECLNSHELSLFAQVVSSNDRDFSAMEKVVAKAHNNLLHDEMNDNVLADICDILTVLHSVVSSETLELVVDTTKKMLSVSQLSPSTLLRVYKLMSVCSHPLPEDIALESINETLVSGDSLQDLPVLNLELLSNSTQSWPLRNLIENISQQCLSDVHKMVQGNGEIDGNKLLYCTHLMDFQLLKEIIAEADIYMLIQMMGHYLSQKPKSKATKRELQAFLERLSELIAGLNEIELNQLLEFNNNQACIILHQFLKTLHSCHIHPNARLAEKLESITNLRLDEGSWDMPRNMAWLRFQQFVDLLVSEKTISIPNLSTLSSLICRLDFDAMLGIFNQLDAIVTLPHASVEVKRQASKVRGLIQEQFCDRLGRLNCLPSSLAEGCTGSGFLFDSNFKRSGRRPGLYAEVLSSLPRLASSCSYPRNNYLRMLAVLESTSELWPTCQDGLLDALVHFVVTSCPESLTPGLHLTKILAHASYTPEDMAAYMLWLWAFVARILQLGKVSKDLQVQLASDMSVQGLFNEEFLCHIFSLNFISGLEVEMKEQPEPYKKSVFHDLMSLSCSVAIECPHLAVACLSHYKGLPYRSTRSDFFNTMRMTASLRRIFEDDQCVEAPAYSPYSHHIDALIVLDANHLPLSGSVAHKGDKVNPSYERLAFLYGTEQHFCLGNEGNTTGPTQAKIRQLQILGYTVILIPYFKLSSMEVHSEEGLDDYMKSIINTAIGMQLFPSAEWQNS